MADPAYLQRTQRLLIPPTRARLVGGLVLAVAGPVLVTPVARMPALEDVPSVPYILTIVLATLVGRLLPGLIAVVASTLLLDYYILPPVRKFDVSDTQGLVELAVFALVAFVVAQLLARQDKVSSESDANRQRLAFLVQASHVLGASLDYERTLNHLARLAVPSLSDWCAIHLWNGRGAIENVVVAHSDPSRVEQARELQRRYPPDPSERTGIPNVMRTGRSELYREVSDALLVQAARDEEHLMMLRGLGIRSAIVAPLIARGRTLGALTLVTAESGRRFGEADLALAEELGERAGLAIDNARLFRDRTHIAQALQQSLLPPALPVIPGFDLAAFYRPGREGVDVGGDFYDAFATIDGRWVLVIGDICGKGPEAAAITGLARHTLKAVSSTEPRPARVLEALNDTMLREEVADRFCTVCYVRLEPADGGGRLVVSAGGHPLPVLVRSDGTIETVGEYGTLLGVYDDPVLEEREALIRPGDVLVLYTDGLLGKTEAQASIEGGALGSVLRSSIGRIAEHMAQAIRLYWDRLPADDRTDDVAVLVMRARPAEPPLRDDQDGSAQP
jgi:serine phosphatase RsbU (regulator of sigma subunit)